MNLKKKIIYQIYPKSFMDSNDDGLGDLRGIIEKIPHLKSLGVDMVWISPFFQSPQNDNGYDISDYYKVDPIYGDNRDLDELIEAFKGAGIDLMFDMVFNHTSTKHEWFQKALAGDKKYQDFYYIREAKPDGSLPNNWTSKFGGPAWNKFGEEGNKYYLCLYDKTQADLNWHNPEVRSELYKIVNHWIDRGVRGFRFDVMNVIGKDTSLVDSNGNIEDEKKLYTDTPIVHEFLRELNKETFGKCKDIITVGEMSSTDIANSILYAGKDTGELSMVFNFHHLKVDYDGGEKWSDVEFDFIELKNILNSWQTKMQANDAVNALFWNNHDQPRANSRFANPIDYPYESATMLAQSIHMMDGVVFIYQGEEFGMSNPNYKSIESYDDIESKNNYKILLEKGNSEAKALSIVGKKSRDNSRSPMQWNSNKYAGFSSVDPWLEVAPNYEDVNCEADKASEKSIFAYYKNLIELRKKYDIISDGEYLPLLEEDPDLFVYSKELDGQKLININNFRQKELELDLSSIVSDYDDYTYLLGNYGKREPSATIKIRPYETVAFIKK